jgi:hypothetical protein
LLRSLLPRLVGTPEGCGLSWNNEPDYTPSFPALNRWRWTGVQVLAGEWDDAPKESLRRLRINLSLIGDGGDWRCKAAAEHIAELEGKRTD